MESSRHPSGPGLMTSRLIVSHLSLHGVVPLRTPEVCSLPLMAQLEASLGRLHSTAQTRPWPFGKTGDKKQGMSSDSWSQQRPLGQPGLTSVLTPVLRLWNILRGGVSLSVPVSLAGEGSLCWSV